MPKENETKKKKNERRSEKREILTHQGAILLSTNFKTCSDKIPYKLLKKTHEVVSITVTVANIKR